MPESIDQPSIKGKAFILQHRFLVMIIGAIIIAIFLVGIAMNLYKSSGTAQLDLSRPGYQSVREQASRTDTFDGFSAVGQLDKAAAQEFNAMYEKRAKKVTSVDGFGSDALGAGTLFPDTTKQ